MKQGAGNVQKRGLLASGGSSRAFKCGKETSPKVGSYDSKLVLGRIAKDS